jgi:hypothetical protein
MDRRTGPNFDRLVLHCAASCVLWKLFPQNAECRTGPLKLSRRPFFCSSNVEDPPDNDAVLNISKILKTVMSSTAKAKLGALYINAREAIPMQLLLKEMGHKQPPRPIPTNNNTAHGVATNSIQTQCTKAMDMRFHWLCCQDAQGQFQYYWRP